MKVVSFISQKGGTSKSTTALNLAVEAVAYGIEVVVLDLDPQRSASEWAEIRGDQSPLVAAPSVVHLPQTIDAVRDNGAELVIIDTAGRLNTEALAAARASDVVFIPLQPSVIDLKTLASTMDIVRDARRQGGNPGQVIALLTRVKAIGSRHDETAKFLGSAGNEVCPVMIGERVVYQDAYALGQGVAEAEPNGKASLEIRDLYLYLSRLLGLPERRQTNE